MFVPDPLCENQTPINSLYAKRKELNLGLNDACKMCRVPRSTFKAYERGLAKPGIYWDHIEEHLGKDAMQSFRVEIDDSDAWMMYRVLLKREYARKQSQTKSRPKSLDEWRMYLGYSPEQMCALFNVSYPTYVKWRKGDIARYQLELVKDLFGEIRL